MRHVLEHWPDAGLLLDTEGRATFANAAALRHWQCDSDKLLGRHADRLLSGLRRLGTEQPMLHRAMLDASLGPIVGACKDAEGRGLLLRCVPFFDAGQAHAGWVVVLIEVTPMHSAVRQRDEALRFLSHDARGAGTAILSMIELARAHPTAFADGSLLPGIEAQAQAGLDLSDGFLRAARAETQPLRIAMLDLLALLQQAIDGAWALARHRGVRVLLQSPLQEAPCLADRGLTMRALADVLGHALQRCSPGAQVDCSVSADEARWHVTLAFPDTGPGRQAALQSPGLLLARTVAQRHGGTLQIDSPPGAGCSVVLRLRRPSAAEPAPQASDKES